MRHFHWMCFLLLSVWQNCLAPRQLSLVLTDVSFVAFRRRHSIFVNKSPPQANTEEDPCSADRVCTNNAPADDDANEESSAECRNYYLDLAGIENYTTSQSHDLVSSARPGCGISRAEKGTKAQRPARCKTKLPSSSSAVNNFEYCNSSRTDAHGTDAICEENETITANVFMTARQESSHFRLSPLNPTFPVAQSNPAANDLETVSSSHYQRRHRHREKNQSRAMKQVAEWIEKEHIYQKTEKRVVVVQRHEHHHVHEHFHHHFHHCSHTWVPTWTILSKCFRYLYACLCVFRVSLPGCLALSSPHSLHPTYPPFCLNFRYLQSNGTHNPGVNFPLSEMQMTQILTLPKMIN